MIKSIFQSDLNTKKRKKNDFSGFKITSKHVIFLFYVD